MKLELENVGKISHANIELNGITVIAGENNTGKSTIGKMLFCVFHAFYKIEEQILSLIHILQPGIEVRYRKRGYSEKMSGMRW